MYIKQGATVTKLIKIVKCICSALCFAHELINRVIKKCICSEL